ncbi:hypothetical protein P7B02_18775 [Caulobacter segnis]|uniref:hypothetical protein n=1 Tax=Caulobacter segnis TaxID=88688 RepID=UPI0024108AF5|nr:hypothetical protein [Caulobacter segnis]MDG2523578.1 hypothetical protein [Caulobacter segnis]
MDLLERYLGAVAALLPSAQRDDITAELRDLLLNRIEEKEAELGRPLTNAEQEAIIQANGHPLVVAGRYGSQGPLIGPAVYPLYMQALKVSLAIGALVTVILTVIALFNQPNQSRVIIQGVHNYVSLTITVVGLLTIAGWLVERGVVKLNFLDNWKPSRLPPVAPELPPLPGLPILNSLGSIGSAPAGAPKVRAKSRFESVFELVVTLWVLAWWLGFTPLPFGELGKGVSLIPSPIWASMHWPIAGLLVVQIAVCLADLLLAAAVRVRAGLALASHLMILAVVWVLWNARPLFHVDVAGHVDAASRTGLMASIYVGVDIALAVTAVIAMVSAGREIWRLARS